jgi:hypothetical protein
MHINKLPFQVNPQHNVLSLALDSHALKRSYKVMCRMQMDCKITIATTEHAPVTIYCSLVWLVPANVTGIFNSIKSISKNKYDASLPIFSPAWNITDNSSYGPYGCFITTVNHRCNYYEWLMRGGSRK